MNSSETLSAILAQGVHGVSAAGHSRHPKMENVKNGARMRYIEQ